MKESPLPIKRKYDAVTRIRTWVTSATTKGTNHYTITAIVVSMYAHSIDTLMGKFPIKSVMIYRF